MNISKNQIVQLLESQGNPEKGVFEVNRDRVAVQLPDVISG